MDLKVGEKMGIDFWSFMGFAGIYHNLVGGWPSPLKNDGVKVNWDDDSSQLFLESHKIHVPNHQPDPH